MDTGELKPVAFFFFLNHYIPYAVLYILWLLCNYQLILLNPFTFFHPGPWHPSILAIIRFFCMSMFLFCLFMYFVLQITRISEIIWYFSFFVWLISLSIIPSRSTHVVANGKISFFFMAEWYFILYMYHHFLKSTCLFMDNRLLPYLGYCK